MMAARPDLAGRIRAGLALEHGVEGVADSAVKALSSAGNLAERVLTATPPKAVSGLVGHASDFVQRHPVGALAAVTGLPILGQAFSRSQSRHEDELMNAYRDPDRVITGSLDEFLETKAAAFGAGAGGGNLFTDLRSGFGKGLGGGLGAGVVGLLAHALGAHWDNTKRVMLDDPRRKALLEQIIRTDSVLRDALERHPDTKPMLLEAYGTMVKFAPTLSMDINAVRSFLREAILSGAGVNYATIKNLVDTERSIADAKPRYGGK